LHYILEALGTVFTIIGAVLRAIFYGASVNENLDIWFKMAAA